MRILDCRQDTLVEALNCEPVSEFWKTSSIQWMIEGKIVSKRQKSPYRERERERERENTMCFAHAKPCSIQKACGSYNRSAVELHQRSSNERPQGTTTQWTFTTLGYSSTICWLVFHRPCLSFWAQKPDICKKNLTIGQEEHLYLHRFVFGFWKGYVMCIYIYIIIYTYIYIRIFIYIYVASLPVYH